MEARTNLLNQSLAFIWAQVCEDAAVLVRKLALSVTSTGGTGSFEEACISLYLSFCLCLLPYLSCVHRWVHGQTSAWVCIRQRYDVKKWAVHVDAALACALEFVKSTRAAQKDASSCCILLLACVGHGSP
ncbi:MAG: hypothetical protein HC767_04140 [Akkermansiaceae bacterium]|nr:hypothetical protein [Akkermansiaceae bacterium]